MTGAGLAAQALAETLMARFEAAGAARIDVPLLLPAETLLDLYGEDIRGRAYTTSDAVRGEQMLRPDFTVPVVQAHMTAGATPARYTYRGEVFRKQDADPKRPNSYLQVGYEVFDAADPARTDAEVFAAILAPVAHLTLRAVVGDIGLLRAAVLGLRTSDRRKAALMRHLWRPGRFRALLERYSGRCPVSDYRAALIAGRIAMPGDAPGRRGLPEIAERVAALTVDAADPPLAAEEVAGVEALLETTGRLDAIASPLRRLAESLPALNGAIASLERRTEALRQSGTDPAGLIFEASFGRTSMEYYDGFVFGLFAPDRPDLPPVASGGRYDALTRCLGGGSGIPAVGGVLRPEVIGQLEAGT